MSNETKLWWISIEGNSTGPFTTSVIRQRIESGEINQQSYVCLFETEEWKPLSEWSGFDGLSLTSPQPPPPPENITVQQPAWNPLAIAWLGLLF